jgi:hypothetical protein
MSTLTTPQLSTPTVSRRLVIGVGIAGLVVAGVAVATQQRIVLTPTTPRTAVTSPFAGASHSGAKSEQHFFGRSALAREASQAQAVQAQQAQERSAYALKMYQLGVPAFGGTGTLAVVGSPQFAQQMSDYVRQLQIAGRSSLAVVGSPQFSRQMSDYVRQLQIAGRGSLAVVGSPQFSRQMSDYVRQLQAAASIGMVSDAVTEDARRLNLVAAQTGSGSITDEQRKLHLRRISTPSLAYGTTGTTDPTRDIGPRGQSTSTGLTDPTRDLGPRS